MASERWYGRPHYLYFASNRRTASTVRPCGAPRAPGYDRLNSHKRSALDVLHRRDRPSTLMSSDRDAKPVHIIEEDAINCACIAVGQDDGPADQLLLGSLQFANYVRCSLVAGARTAHERRVHQLVQSYWTCWCNARMQL